MLTCCSNNKKPNRLNIKYNIKHICVFFTIVLITFAFLIILNNYFSFNCVCAEQGNNNSIEEELTKTTTEILEDLNFEDLELLLSEVNQSLFFGEGFKGFVTNLIKGEKTIEVLDLFNVFLVGIKQSIKSVLAPLFLILVIVLLCTMFNNVKAGKLTGVGEIIYFVCFAIVITIVVSISTGVVADAKGSIVLIQKQINSIFPVLITLMGLMGGAVSSKAFSPMFAFLGSTISNIFLYVLLPLFLVSIILSIIGNLSSNTKLDKLNGFVHSLFKWIIGVVFAIFMMFISVNGITAGAADGISIKATKYAIKNYIPMLGGYISEGFELVKAGGMLVKNATGFAGIILLFITVVTPLISVGILELGLKLLAGIIEPMGDNRSCGLLFNIAKSLRLLVVVLVGISLMYFISIFLTTCSISNFL